MFFLRKADKLDADILFEWVNDPEVRKASFRQEKIDFAEHFEWFKNIINDEKYNLFIFMNDNIPVGQIRLFSDNERIIINYSIAKEFRGKGLASLMINQAENWLREKMDTASFMLVARVKFDNIASQKTFMSLDYTPEMRKDYIEYEKQL